MKSKLMSYVRTLALLGIVAIVGTGAANAGGLEVGHVIQPPGAAGNNGFVFSVANTGAMQASDVRVYLNGQAGTASCAGTTSAGRAFALAGSLGAGENVVCSGAAAGGSTSITVLGTGGDGAPLVYTAHVSQLAAAPGTASLGILVGVVFNDADNNDQFDVGETLDFSYTIYNLGSVALSGIVVSDQLNSSISCPQTTLAAGGAMVCTATHTVVAAETRGAPITVIANVDATDPDGNPTNSQDSTVRTANGPAEIRGLKSPLFVQDNDGNGVAGSGDLLTYTFALKNSSGFDLGPVTMTEADPSRIDTPITCNGTTVGGQAFSGLGSGTLVVGDSVLCTADYTLDDADVTKGEANNLVNITGQPLTAAGNKMGGVVSGSAASALVVPPPPPPQTVGPQLAVPVNDWRALVLLGLGLLMVAVVATRRKTHKR